MVYPGEATSTGDFHGRNASGGLTRTLNSDLQAVPEVPAGHLDFISAAVGVMHVELSSMRRAAEAEAATLRAGLLTQARSFEDACAEQAQILRPRLLCMSMLRTELWRSWRMVCHLCLILSSSLF